MIESQLLNKHSSLIKSFYQNRLIEIKNTVALLNEEAAEIRNFLKDLEDTVPPAQRPAVEKRPEPVIFESGYRNDWPLITKTIFVLGERGDSTLSEIADYIKTKFEPEIDLQILKANLSAVLSVDAKKYNKLNRYHNDKNEWTYKLK